MDIRIQTMPFEFDGKYYELRCNMNVFADVQEAYNGNLLAALRNPSSLKASMTFLVAMINDYADDQGWPERYTVKQLGRMLGSSSDNIKILTTEIGSFIRKSVTMKKPTEGQGDNEKNGLTTPSR